MAITALPRYNYVVTRSRPYLLLSGGDFGAGFCEHVELDLNPKIYA
jgi:hypothetical protein